MAWLGQAMFNVVLLTGIIESMNVAEAFWVLREFLPACVFAVTGEFWELRAVVRQHRVDFIGHRHQECPQEVRGDPAGGLVMQLSKGKLAVAIDGHKQIQSAFFGMHFGDAVWG